MRLKLIMAGMTGIHGYSTKGTQNLHLQYSQQDASLVLVLTYTESIITVVLRDSLRITPWYLGVRKVFKLKVGSLDVSGKLSTYPSPKPSWNCPPTPTLSRHELSTYPSPKPSWNCPPTPSLSRHETVHLPPPLSRHETVHLPPPLSCHETVHLPLP